MNTVHLPTGPIITLVYRVAPEQRDQLLSFLRSAVPYYQAPGGIRIALYESMDDPGLLLELVAYASEAAFAIDQQRVENDETMKKVLSDWHELIDGSVEVRRMKPIAIE